MGRCIVRNGEEQAPKGYHDYFSEHCREGPVVGVIRGQTRKKWLICALGNETLE